MENEIIVSIDSLSPNNELIKSGIYVAKHFNAELSLLDFQFRTIAVNFGAITATQGAMGFGNAGLQVIDQKERVQKAEIELNKISVATAKEWPHTTAKLYAPEGPVWEGDKSEYLIEEVNEQRPMLVMQTIKNDLNKINELLGTPETKLAEEADCPVLLLPENTSLSNVLSINYILEKDKLIEEVMKEVLFLRALLSKNAIKKAINIIYYFGDTPETAEKEIALKKSILIREIGSDYLNFHNLSSENIEEHIQENIKKQATHLFAFPKRNKSIIERLISHDNTKRLILKSQIPVLVF